MKQFPTIMNNRIDYIEDRIWIQKKIQLQEYFNKLEPKHSIVSSLGIPLKYSGYFALIPSNLDLEAHLAQYPITDYMFVQDNRGIIRSVSKYGGIGSSLKFDPVRFIYILGLISSIPARNKDSITETGYVSINSKLIRNFFKDYLSYLDYLILTGVLETKGQYIQGKQSKGYRFTERYANAPLVRYDYPAFIQNTDNVASIQEEIYNKKTGNFVHNPILDFPYLSYWYSTKGLQIDEEAALTCAYQMMQDKISKGIQSWDINRDKSRNNLIKRKNPLTQYSFDNAAGQKVSNDDVVVENPKITDLQVKLLNDNIISPDQDISFEISYDVNEDIETYIAFSLTDIDRGIWIYNDNSMDNKTSGSGRKTLTYKCSLAHLNNIKLKLQVSVRDKDDQMIAFADSENSPVILLNRTDIEDDDKSAKDSATGMVQRNGKWEIQE